MLLGTDADNEDLLYMRAVCHRCTGRFDEALRALARLKALAPEHGRACQEEGHCYRDMGQADQALFAYTSATRFNQALEASWREQRKILLNAGHELAAEQINRQLEYLQRLPRPLVGVIDLLAQGKLLKAEDICRQFLQKNPHHVEAMRLLADIAMRFGALDDAEFLLHGARQIAPDNTRVHIDYIQAFRKRQKCAARWTKAISCCKRHRTVCSFSLYLPSSPCKTALRNRRVNVRQHSRTPAWRSVTLTSKGHACKTSGQYEDAVAAYRSASQVHRSMAKRTTRWPT